MANNAAVAAVARAPLEDGRFIRIRGEEVWVGELSLNQLVALLHFGRRLVQSMDSVALVSLIQQGQAASTNGQMSFTPEQLQQLIDLGMSVLTMDQVNELVGILIDRDTAWVAERPGGRPRITTSVLGHIIGTLAQHNDMREVLGVFQRAWRAIPSRRSTDNSSLPSSG